MACEDLQKQFDAAVAKSLDLQKQLQDPTLKDPQEIALLKKALNTAGAAQTAAHQLLYACKLQNGLIPPAPAILDSISITLNTHKLEGEPIIGGLAPAPDTVAHIFIKNRCHTSSTPESATTFIENELAFEANEGQNGFDINPYLGRLKGTKLQSGQLVLNIPLRSAPIPTAEVVLPVVNIHILSDGKVTWMFDYVVTFTFQNPQPGQPQLTYSASSNTDGITGIVLDQDNCDHSGICTENIFNPLSPFVKPPADALLYMITVDFVTTGGSKPKDTQLNIHIVNRQSATSSQDLAIGLDLFKGQELVQEDSSKPSLPRYFSFTTTTNPLSSNAIRMGDIVLPMVSINLGTKGNVRWAFEYRVRYYFINQKTYYSTQSGVILTQDYHKCAHVYRGDSFPRVAPPPPAALSASPDTSGKRTKTISVGFIQNKLKEFINDRQGVIGTSPSPALYRLRLDNSGGYGVQRESYYDLQSIDANPPAPGTITTAGYNEPVDWDSSPTSLGQIEKNSIWGLGALFLNDINSNSLMVTLDGTKDLPLSVFVSFETTGPEEIIGNTSASRADMHFKEFSIQLNLSLTRNPKTSAIDLMSWADNQKLAHDDTLLEPYIHVIATASAEDFGGKFQKSTRAQIFTSLTTPDPFTGKTPRDNINALANSWFLGGAVSGLLHTENNCVVLEDLKVTSDAIHVTYTGPKTAFNAPQPANWPAGVDFTPGSLANIDHIVVLTMENRSFDQMLGYLSLPPEKGGAGRTDVDGLKGNEFNLLNGTRYPSFPFPAGDTIFSPDPPHSYEPVSKAINGGKMDGFVSSYNEERGPTVAPRIMGYHTPVNIPTYDALARDFSICHRWFAPHPGPTFCNRFYELTGRLNIDIDGFWELSNSSPLRPVFTKTIFDYLSDAGVSWKYFEHGYCFLRFFENYTFNPTNIVSFDDPVQGFLKAAATGTLPSVTFIDPHFVELPPGGNCDGPPADVAQGQILVQKVVEAVVTSPNWNKTMLIVTYDEHGGFFDHVPPPPAAQVAPGLPATFGVRVPAFIVSPWVGAGTVFGKDASTTPSLYFDHTSILKTIAKRFLSTKPPYMGPRYAAAHDLSSVIGSQPRSGPFLPFAAYNLVYSPSKKRLDVQGGSNAAGTLLWQYDANDTDAQKFTLEDAGSGRYYIRTHAGSLYVTVDAPVSSTAKTLGIKQDVKYPAGSPNSDLQKWILTSSSATPVSGVQYVTIQSVAFAGKLLHSAGESVASTGAVVLDTAGVGGLTANSPFVWEVSRPGTQAGQPPLPSIKIDSSTIVFASIPEKQVDTKSLSITNAGSVNATITVPTSPLPTTAAFYWTAGSHVIAPGAKLTIDVNFSPKAIGAAQTQLSINSDAVGSPFQITLRGTGVKGSAQ